MFFTVFALVEFQGSQSMKTSRIHSIDFLRGVVMVLMAIDHSRTFLHEDFPVFNAEDLGKTSPALFFTRWVTHFCAPVFIFLAGTSAYLMQVKTGSKKKVFIFLITRALILIFLELTLFRFLWNFSGSFTNPFALLVVIWAIGISMIFLAFLIYLPYRAILVFGLAVLLLHNLLANVSFPEGSAMSKLWAFIYTGGFVPLGKASVFVLYPALPYFGLIALGYCLGYLFTPSFSTEKRKLILSILGTSAIVVFVILRYFNLYGDPRPWETGKNAMYSFMAFLKTTKYPVSLHFALMTLGPALLTLAFIEPIKNAAVKFFVVIGSVPMFYYVLHLIFFSTIARITGFYKYDLAMVYVWFVIVVFVLYLLCLWYSKYKFNHPEKKWLKYL